MCNVINISAIKRKKYGSNMSAFSRILVLAAFVLAAANAMMVKTKVANPGNLCRKMKRIIKTSDAAIFEKEILTPENDLYLREGCSGAIYSNLMEKVAKKALELKVTVKPGFGVKAIVVLPDLVEMAVAAGTFKTLVAAVQACGLVDTLKGDRFTVFAPSDEAFAKLPEGTVEALLADIPKLTAILTLHVTPGTLGGRKVTALSGNTFATVNGQPLGVKVGKVDQVITIGEQAKVVKADIKCSNGLIHVIDTVIMPK